MTQNKMRIAITGGIGSGKSTVADIISETGYKVISCDEIYKQLLKDNDFITRVCEEFGNVLDSQGNLDRKKLSRIVFSDEGKRKRLNELTHPKIMQEALRQMADNPISFCEVPLLFEEGYETLFDKVIVVLRNKSDRVQSVMIRDNIGRDEVLNRINSQFSYDNLPLEKYYVIHNSSNLADLCTDTLKILYEILKIN